MSGTRPTVLVVDDDTGTMDQIIDALGEDVKACVAVNGASAIEVAQRVRPDLILLDVMMPVMNGFEVCRRLKQEPALRGIPVIFLTAMDDLGGEALGLELGAVDYITKPFSPVIVKARVHNHLELKLYRDQLNALVLQRSREQHAVLSNISDLVWLKDTGGSFLTVNVAFAAFYGLADPQALIGKREDDLWPEAMARQRADRDDGVIRTGRPLETVEPVDVPEGRKRWLETIRTPIYDEAGKLQGMVGVARDTTERKAREEEIAQANVLLRSLTGRLAEVEECQLKAISRELHDRIGQNLSAIGLNLTVIRTYLSLEDGRKRIDTALEDATNLLQETSARIRHLLTEMRSPVLDDHGLLSALRVLADQYGRRGDLKINVRGKNPAPRPSPVVENALFRIAQEGLNNVLKHAEASRAILTLSTRQGKLLFSMQDNGKGCDPAALDLTSGQRGWGLITMKERALAVGGDLRISSARGEGTRLSVEVTL